MSGQPIRLTATESREAVARLTRRGLSARTAMLVAPVVGLLLGALAWTAGAAVTAAGGGSLLAAVTCLSVLAAATRGLHLDGLADLADGLGSAQPAEGALEVMHRPDIGPFGAVTLVLALLVQAAALDTAWEAGQPGRSGSSGSSPAG